jgi:hypothetical protein
MGFTQCGGHRAFRIDITTSSTRRAWHLHHLVKTTRNAYCTLTPILPRPDGTDWGGAGARAADAMHPTHATPSRLKAESEREGDDNQTRPDPTPTQLACPSSCTHTDATSADPTTSTPWERDVVGGTDGAEVRPPHPSHPSHTSDPLLLGFPLNA